MPSAAQTYMERFLTDVKWTYDDAPYTVRVENYMNTETKRFEKAAAAWSAIAEVLSELVVGVHSDGKPKFKSHFKIVGAPYSFEDEEIWCTFHGKASPNTITKTCWLAMYCGLILGPSPGRQLKPSKFEPRSPQKFADDCLGTDCSGFVNLFHGRKTGHMKIKQYDTGLAARREDAQSILPGDVLVGSGHGHIAIVESVERAALPKPKPKPIAKRGMGHQAPLLPKPIPLVPSMQRAEPLPEEIWQVRVVESSGENGVVGVTMDKPRMIRMELPSERLFIQVRSHGEKPHHYYFLPPIVRGQPVP